MNFTREPIIETVITPRKGCKLVVRSSKGASQEDYFVDAVEVVSFGHSFFFRSQERPKSFLVPVSDYEILELKETRMVLKNVATERSIKIGGGKDNSNRSKEEGSAEKSETKSSSQEARSKRDKRRRNRRSKEKDPKEEAKSSSELEEDKAIEEIPSSEKPADVLEGKEGQVVNVEPKAPSFISKLFPPPRTLIKESLSRYKTEEEASSEESIANQEEEKPKQEDDNEE